MKNKLKIFLPKHQPSAGFTLVELLVSIAIMGITSSLISYAIGSMISSNQSLAKEQNRRTEVSRALELITTDIKGSIVEPVGNIPSSITVQGSPILYLKPLALETCSTDSNKVIVYSIEPTTTSTTTAIGPNVIYRYGLISNSNGNYDCNDTPQSTPIADAVSLGSLTAPDCVATDITDFYTTGTNGFYSCVSDNQVTVALLTKFAGNKIYGVTQTTNSGAPVTVSSTAGTTCTVPNLLTGGTGGVPFSPTEANTAIANANLRYYAINTESGGSTVLSQNPLPGSKIPCNKGLVTYTY
jgi:prepilin-type N-terminal cleavage/methylation domain-containing protein